MCKNVKFIFKHVKRDENIFYKPLQMYCRPIVHTCYDVSMKRLVSEMTY